MTIGTDEVIISAMARDVLDKANKALPEPYRSLVPAVLMQATLESFKQILEPRGISLSQRKEELLDLKETIDQEFKFLLTSIN